MAAPRKFDDATRKRILQLHVHERHSAQETADILEQDGITISAYSVRDIAKVERLNDVAGRPKAEQLAHLLTGLVTATNSEISRINAKNEAVDGDQLLKLARTVREIEPLLTDKPTKKDQEPSGLLGNLTSNGQDKQQTSNTGTNGGNPVSARAAS